MKEMSSRIAFGILILASVTAALVFVWPFVPAILWAATFSILLYPLYQKLKTRGWKDTSAALAVTLIPALVLFIPSLIIASIAGVQAYGYVSDLVASAKSGGSQSVWLELGRELNNILGPLLSQAGATNVDFQKILIENQDVIAKNLSGPLTNGLKSFVVTIVTLVISLLTTFFMIRDSHHLVEPVTDLVPLPKAETEAILKRMAATVKSVFFAVVVVALIQGAIAGLSYLIAGVQGWLVWTVVTAVLCMIPMLGAPVVFIPIGASLLIQGKIWQGIFVLGVGFFVVSTIDNYLKPIFISGETKIHPMAIFFALLGGVVVLGPVGLMAGPLLLTLVLAFIDVFRVRRKIEQESTAELANQE